VGDLVDEVKKQFDWKPMAMVMFGMCMGIFTGMQLNVDAQAHGQAQEMCKVCDANLATMVQNFNTIAYQCKVPTGNNPYRDLPTMIGNGTVRVYEP
jgi:hypothetical protein